MISKKLLSYVTKGDGMEELMYVTEELKEVMSNNWRGKYLQGSFKLRRRL